MTYSKKEAAEIIRQKIQANKDLTPGMLKEFAQEQHAARRCYLVKMDHEAGISGLRHWILHFKKHKEETKAEDFTIQFTYGDKTYPLEKWMTQYNSMVFDWGIHIRNEDEATQKLLDRGMTAEQIEDLKVRSKYLSDLPKKEDLNTSEPKEPNTASI